MYVPLDPVDSSVSPACNEGSDEVDPATALLLSNKRTSSTTPTISSPLEPNLYKMVSDLQIKFDSMMKGIRWVGRMIWNVINKEKINAEG